MSRIGKKPIDIPSGVKVTVADGNILVEGKEKLSMAMPPFVTAEVKENQVLVSAADESRKANAMHGLARSLIQNMVIGVSQGFRKELQIVGIGYKAAVAGNKLNMSLGYSHPIEFQIPAGIKVTVTPENKITVEGCDKQLVGETAAQIRRFRKPEPYKGKGIRYVDERIVLKEGKSVG
ncbi:MAG: 50S ribosomal protein L6 [Lentisphaeria bacterium]|nr:50S ribosomal protein L6 [Lentisphaerota bacterium]MBR2625362.1 50S ribosomal protein L6 [Lentisphaeria bacterium]